MIVPETKIEIVYVIRAMPIIFLGARTIAEIEGDLQIFIGTELFLDEENILLLELAIAFDQWLRKINKNIISDFYYASMDYEEEPILNIAENQDNKWKLFSVWQQYASKYELGLNEITPVIAKYVRGIKQQLLNDPKMQIERQQIRTVFHD